ncbi:N-acetylmuramoyl-L-alanine amidase [Streptomyces sp. NPDC087428]|uniref:N-acetylmuramoyl-L-alanine amidase n=1 Tax=Streptomyces sp. NPDC087428 TaxID=3365788 RepID=UPI003802D17C
MANPMPADFFLKALLAEGLTVVQEGSWREHNRNHKGAWGPVNGVVIHHTVTEGTAATVRIVRDGYADLPGPLCHGMIAKDGRVYLVGYGRTNHAGLGDGDVLAAVIAERPLPADNEANTDGNRHFFGFECENLGDGKDPWPAVQLDSIERAAAAICRYYGWGAASVIGHLEWQPGKVDPRGFTMAGMRARIETRLAHPASWNSSPKEDDMTPAQEALLHQIAADVAELKKNAAKSPWTYRNEAQDAASLEATGKRIPDMHGRVEAVQRDLTVALAILKKGA